MKLTSIRDKIADALFWVDKTPLTKEVLCVLLYHSLSSDDFETIGRLETVHGTEAAKDFLIEAMHDGGVPFGTLATYFS